MPMLSSSTASRMVAQLRRVVPKAPANMVL